MNSEIKYELPIFSSNLEKDPVVESKDMNIGIELIGVDEENRLRKIVIRFNSVICSKHTSARFTPKLYDSYDRVVELVDSEWLEELRDINEEDYNYWKPKHYIMYLVQRIINNCHIHLPDFPPTALDFLAVATATPSKICLVSEK